MSKNLLKKAVFSVLYLIFKIWNFFARQNQITALAYHSIGYSGWEFSVAPETFERQIRYLYENNYRFLTTEDLLNIISSQNNRIKKGALITFDDGYGDFMNNAAPILNKYNTPAVIFIHTNRSPERLRNNVPLLEWQEIKSLTNKFEIGSHSHSHPNLKKLSASELEDDINKSTRLIEEMISRKPNTFAYPFGLFNHETIETLKRNSYKLGFTIDRGMIKAGDDPFRIKRFGVAKNTSFVEFKARLTPASDWYERLIKSLKFKV